MAKMRLFPAKQVAVDAGTRVLKAADYAVLLEAEDVLAAARRQAERIHADALTDAETRRREGYEAGLLEGKLEASAQMFESVTASLEQLEKTEHSLVDVVMQSIRAILGSFDKEELAKQTVGHALRIVRDEKKVVLRVCPEDVDMVQSCLAGIVARYPGMGRIDVAADPALTSGGCVMDTEIGVIDATIDRQLAIIEETFRRHIEERPG